MNSNQTLDYSNIQHHTVNSIETELKSNTIFYMYKKDYKFGKIISLELHVIMSMCKK